MSEYLAWVRAVFVCFNVLHQHTHTYLGPDPAVGLEPRADKYGPARNEKDSGGTGARHMHDARRSANNEGNVGQAHGSALTPGLRFN